MENLFEATMYTYYYNDVKLAKTLQLRLYSVLYRVLLFLLLIGVTSICIVHTFVNGRKSLFANSKVLLLWSHKDYAPFYYFGEGRSAFIKNNCSFTNCHVTTNRYLLDDITQFDAIAFNGRRLFESQSKLPLRRSPHQKYIYVNMESPQYHYVCNDIYDGFFNWTATHRLDSDIPLTYILIKNRTGQVVGPKPVMEWLKDMHNVNNAMLKKLRGKTKSVAWFVSNCNSRSHREDFVNKLKRELLKYNLKVDVYGKCGMYKCPRGSSSCGKKIKKDYYFYLALENSFAEDYVTEKVFWAFNNSAVPVVLGGANYSRFLPPGSYLHGSPRYVAGNIATSVRNFSRYKDFFKWRPYYTFSQPMQKENICALCAALNNQYLMETKTVYREFRKWWYPKYKLMC